MEVRAQNALQLFRIRMLRMAINHLEDGRVGVVLNVVERRGELLDGLLPVFLPVLLPRLDVEDGQEECAFLFGHLNYPVGCGHGYVLLVRGTMSQQARLICSIF